MVDPVLEAWEVFRQEKEGDAMKHGGSVMAPDAELAVHYARELFGRRQESIRLWVVRRADIHDLSDPDLLQPPLDRWWGPLMQMHGPRSARETDRDIHWKIKAKTSEELRQEFLTIYVPRIRELGLVIPDSELRLDEATGQWLYAEPDWAELRTVVTNHGPMSQARLEFRRLAREDTRWVRETILGVPAAA